MSDVRGTRALVTGADGFIGSHLVERLVSEGADVRALCLYNSQGTPGWLTSSSARKSVDLRLGDIRDAEWASEVCRDIDVVFHLAALIAIPYSYAAPRSFVDTNVTGTLNMLEGARRHRVRRFVHTSTSEVYGTPSTLPIRETHPLRAQSPYAATKVAADQLALSYHLGFGVPVTVLRPFNTYGPRQSSRAVLMTILTQLLAGKKRIALGRLDTKRDMTFVSDTVDGFLRAATASDIVGEVIQLGTGETHSIADIFRTAREVLNVDAEVFEEARRLRPDASEVLVLQSDPSQARQRLGWAATTNLREGLGKSAKWLQENLGAYDLDYFHV